MILSSSISCVDLKVMENLLRGKVEFCPSADGQMELENDPTFTEKKNTHPVISPYLQVSIPCSLTAFLRWDAVRWSRVDRVYLRF